MKEERNRFGNLFNLTTYSSGFGTISDWIDAAKAKNLSCISFCENGNLSSFATAYQKLQKTNTKIFPAIMFGMKSNPNAEYAFEDIIVAGLTEKGYYDLVYLRNKLGVDSQSKYRPVLEDNVLGGAIYDKYGLSNSLHSNDLRVFIPINSCNITQLLTIIGSGNIDFNSNYGAIYFLQVISSIYYYFSKYTSSSKLTFTIPVCKSLTVSNAAYGLAKVIQVFSNEEMFTKITESARERHHAERNGLLEAYEWFHSPLNSEVRDNVTKLSMILSPYGIGYGLDEYGFPIYNDTAYKSIFDAMFVSGASYPVKEKERLAHSYKDISISSAKRDFAVDGYLRTETEARKYLDKMFSRKNHKSDYIKKDVEAMKILAGFIRNNIDFVEKLNFSLQLYNFRLPHQTFHLADGTEITSEQKFDELLIKGWVDYSKLHIAGRYTIGNWKDENVSLNPKSIEEIFALNTKRSQRLKTEYDVIKSLGFVDYFLMVWDIIDFCDRKKYRRNKCGRGSVGGSLIAYLMKIIGIDPIDSPHWNDLLFERFLNVERVKESRSLPDIDLDFSEKTRKKVMKYIAEKYGEDHICHIGTVQKLKINSAIKDLHREYDGYIPTNNHVKDYSQISVKHSVFYSQEMINTILTERNFAKIKKEQSAEEVIAEAIATSESFMEFYSQHSNWIDNWVVPLCKGNRSPGIHASGILILPDSAERCLPCRYSKGTNQIISDNEMADCESLGWVKVDLLGLSAVEIIDYAAALVKKRHNVIVPDVDSIDFTDPVVFGEIRRDTHGVFQFKSSIQRSFQQRLKPDRISQLVASVAILRTGPMKAGAHEDYLRIEHKHQNPEYGHPLIEKVLKETHGLIIYQEQVMKLVGELANFSLVQADNLRRAIGKKKPEELKKQKEAFVAGCQSNNIPEEVIEDIWQKIDYFSGYGFNQCCTGETMIHMPFIRNESKYFNKVSPEAPIAYYEATAKKIVSIPIMYAYLARNIRTILERHFKKIENQYIDIEDEEAIKKYLPAVLAEFQDNAFTYFDAWNKLVENGSEFRSTSRFVGSPEYCKLIEIALSNSYGTTMGYHQGVGVPRNIVDIIRLGHKQPIIRIDTGNGKTFRAGPTHKFIVWDEETGTRCEKMAANITPEDYIFAIDHNSVNETIKANDVNKIATIRPDIARVTQSSLADMRAAKGLTAKSAASHYRDEMMFVPTSKQIVHHTAQDADLESPQESFEEYQNSLGVFSESFNLVDTMKAAIFPTILPDEVMHNHTDFNWRFGTDQSKYGVPCTLDRVVSVDVEPSEDFIYEVEIMHDEDDDSHLYFANGLLNHNSHAVGYSTFAFLTLYLKAYYPAEFWCAALKEAPTNKKMSGNIWDMKAHLDSIGVVVQFPRLEAFNPRFYPIDFANSVIGVTWPMSSIKDIGVAVSEEIYAITGGTGRFESLSDFFSKCCNKGAGTKMIVDLKVFRALLFSGFFDDILRGKVDDKPVSKARQIAIEMFFNYSSRNKKQDLVVKEELQEICKSRARFFDKQVYYCSSILKPIEKTFPVSLNVFDASDFKNTGNNQPVFMCGVIASARNFRAKNGAMMSIIDVVNFRMDVRVVIFESMYNDIKSRCKVPAEGQVIELAGIKQINQYGVSVVLSDPSSCIYDIIANVDPNNFRWKQKK